MEEKRRMNPAIPVLIILSAALLFLSAFLWLAKEKAEKAAENYRTEYEKLAEEKERAEKAAREKEKQAARYEADMKGVVQVMLDGGVNAENCANLMQSVWHNCIFEISDSKTDKFTKDSSGKFYDDFNDALDNLYGDDEFLKDCQAIKENQDEVLKTIRNLKNPPDEWKDAYAELLLYYDSYYEFTELVLNTNCSLNEFKELFKEYDNESVKHYNKMKLYLE